MSNLLQTLLSRAESYRLTTEEFADQRRVKPQSVRKQYAATGSYFGIRPLPLPNRRLLWPDDSIQRLAEASLSPRVCETSMIGSERSRKSSYGKAA